MYVTVIPDSPGPCPAARTYWEDGYGHVEPGDGDEAAAGAIHQELERPANTQGGVSVVGRVKLGRLVQC